MQNIWEVKAEEGGGMGGKDERGYFICFISFFFFCVRFLDSLLSS